MIFLQNVNEFQNELKFNFIWKCKLHLKILEFNLSGNAFGVYNNTRATQVRGETF